MRGTVSATATWPTLAAVKFVKSVRDADVLQLGWVASRVRASVG